jgi:cardiolipin synthase A/B
MLKRDHRKLLTVDGLVAFVGGAGITDDFDPASSSGPAWHDLMLQIRGPCVGDWETLFIDTWQSAVGNSTSALAKRQDPDNPVPANGCEDGRVVGSATAGATAVMRTLISRVGKSRHRIWITTAYFAPTRRLRRALTRAARNGIDVRLLLSGPETDLPGVWHAGRRFYGRLLRSGVRIFEYQPTCLHAKFALCDDWATFGSSNFDHWTLRWNLEANHEVMDSDVIGQAAMLFQHDITLSHEWTRQAWRQRGWRARFSERFFGTVDDWLMRIRAPRRLPRGQIRRPHQGPERP